MTGSRYRPRTTPTKPPGICTKTPPKPPPPDVIQTLLLHYRVRGWGPGGRAFDDLGSIALVRDTNPPLEIFTGKGTSKGDHFSSEAQHNTDNNRWWLVLRYEPPNTETIVLNFSWTGRRQNPYEAQVFQGKFIGYPELHADVSLTQ